MRFRGCKKVKQDIAAAYRELFKSRLKLMNETRIKEKYKKWFIRTLKVESRKGDSVRSKSAFDLKKGGSSDHDDVKWTLPVTSWGKNMKLNSRILLARWELSSHCWEEKKQLRVRGKRNSSTTQWKTCYFVLKPEEMLKYHTQNFVHCDLLRSETKCHWETRPVFARFIKTWNSN